jgi:hypothetical protein
MRAREKFADDVASENLLNAVRLRLVDEGWHRDSTDAGGNSSGVSGSVIAAANKASNREGKK